MASATVSASTLRNATASGYLNARHIYVSIYLLPDLLLGKGLTRSKAIPEKGVEIKGVGGEELGEKFFSCLLAFWA